MTVSSQGYGQAKPTAPCAAPTLRRFLLGTRFHAGALQQTFLYILLVAVGITMASPVYWMVSTALKTEDLVFQIPPIWWTWPWEWHNFPDALSSTGLPVYLYGSTAGPRTNLTRSSAYDPGDRTRISGT